MSASLPLDFLVDAGGEIHSRPAVLLAPAHLKASSPPPFARSAGQDPASIASVSYASTASTSAGYDAGGTLGGGGQPGGTGTETMFDGLDALGLGTGFIDLAAKLLADPSAGTAATQMARAADASYDFEHYVLLRERDDPIVQIGYPPQPIPADPRYDRFLGKARDGIAAAIEYSLLPLGRTALQLGGVAGVLRDNLFGWWSSICGIRVFNRLARYDRDQIAEAAYGQTDKSPEAYYAACLGSWLMMNDGSDMTAYFSGTSNAIDDMFTPSYWENALNAVFDVCFADVKYVDPGAPSGNYPFEPFPPDEIVFGLRVIHRQSWRQLAFARGDLVGTVPLGPREAKKVSVKTTRRSKTAQMSEETRAFETSAETATTSKDTTEVVSEATSKLNRNAEAEVSGGYPPFFNAKVSGGISEDTGSSSKQTKTNLNEMMAKTASRMKRDTKVTFSTEGETTFEQVGSSELTNPNDEVSITYLYHRLQQRYWVSTQIDEVNSVIFVPEPIPDFDDINEEWIRAHGEIITGSLLDPSFGPTVAAIRSEPDTLGYPPAAEFQQSAVAAIKSISDPNTYSGGSELPDILGSGQQYFERDYERRATLAMAQARRKHQVNDLITHIRSNILYYMRAIWEREDPDQRMQRFSRLRVPIVWTFVPRTPVPAGGSDRLDVDGVFIPNLGSAAPLDDVIDPVGPIGYLFNCSIWRVRDDFKLANLHQALAHLRATYTRFAVTVSFASNSSVSVRQAVAVAPRRFSADYTITYRTQRGKWLIPVPNRPEVDWIEIANLPDGSIDVMGIRVWLDGSPMNQETGTVSLRVTGELEDPHFRLVKAEYPLPPAAQETAFFSDTVLEEMANLFEWAGPAEERTHTWKLLSPVQQAEVRRNYHRYLMLRETGRLVTLDTAHLVLDLEVGRSAALEPFKRLHRYIDVMKEYEEMRRRLLENHRRRSLLEAKRFADPEIERIMVAAGPSGQLRDLVVLDGDDEPSNNPNP